MNYAQFTWYKQEYLMYKAHFEALPIAPFSLRLVSKVFHKDVGYPSYRPVYVFIKHKSAITSSLISFSNSIYRCKEMCCF
jgi:hypothetical protein